MDLIYGLQQDCVFVDAIVCMKKMSVAADSTDRMTIVVGGVSAASSYFAFQIIGALEGGQGIFKV